MTHVLDSNISIYYLGGRLAQPLPTNDILVSVITEIEVLSYPQMTLDEEAKAAAFLSSVIVIALTPEVRDSAIRLRREHRLKLPDAIVAATAFVLNAELLTNDGRLLRLPELRVRSVRLRDA